MKAGGSGAPEQTLEFAGAGCANAGALFVDSSGLGLGVLVAFHFVSAHAHEKKFEAFSG